MISRMIDDYVKKKDLYVPERAFGVCIWIMPDGKPLSDGDGVLCAEGVMNDKEGKYVFALSTDSEDRTRAVVRRIATGLSTSDHTEVISGLSEGDRVVLFGQTMIEEGDLVKVITAGEED